MTGMQSCATTLFTGALAWLFASMALAQPSNDNFASSTSINGQSGVIILDNTGASKEPGEPDHAGNAGGHSIWLTLLGVSGQVFVDTEGSQIDTLLATYTGNSPSALNLLGQNDDRDAGAVLSSSMGSVAVRASTSRTSFNVVGIPYRIAIDGKNGAQGKIRLRWRSQSLGPLTSGVAAVAPTGRAVQVGNLVSGFATIINSGSIPAKNCGLGLTLGLPVSGFSYQTTDPSTNTPVGSADTPVDIAAGGSQSYVFSFTPTGVLNAEPVEIAYRCDNMNVVAAIDNVNVFNTTATSDPTADLVSISATVDGDGIVKVPEGGAGAFSIAAINIGVAANVAFAASAVGAQNQAVFTVQVCETDAQANCLQPPGPIANTVFGANETHTYSVFLFHNGAAVPLDPAKNRIAALFATGGGVTAVGSTGVAVQTITP